MHCLGGGVSVIVRESLETKRKVLETMGKCFPYTNLALGTFVSDISPFPANRLCANYMA
jgi:hypothetical protein